MSMRTRGLVFATFFGNCLVVGLLVASLTTDYWIHAQAKRHSNLQHSHNNAAGLGNITTNINSTTHTTDSSIVATSNATAAAAAADQPAGDGRINFGLFSGYKNLNVGYGDRPSAVDVVAFMRAEPGAMSWWLWLGAALGVGFGTLASALGAIGAVLKSAAMGKRPGTMVLLFVSNVASAISQMLAFVCWLVQFYEYLQHNVLTLADRQENAWYSSGMAQLGHSFFLVAAAILVVLLNVGLLSWAVHLERAERRRGRHDDPAYDEKQQGAIMLY